MINYAIIVVLLLIVLWLEWDIRRMRNKIDKLKDEWEDR